MTKDDDTKSTHRQWAEFRYSVIGALFASPPGGGELANALSELAKKTWQHPLSGKPMQIGFSTIEAWYYAAKKGHRDPVGRLKSKTRSDVGKSRSLSAENIVLLKEQYQKYPSWTYQLHADNLRSSLSQQPSLDILPSYPSVRRFMKINGLFRSIL